MNALAQALTFPGIILPAFVGTALLLAVLLRFRRIALPAGIVLAIGCAAFALLPSPRGPVQTQDSAPSIEVDMMVSRGHMVELRCNDWQLPAEQVAVVEGERHVYRFTQIPKIITLIRLDPTELPDSQVVIYSLTVKAGGRTVRKFGSAELKAWTLHDLSPPKEEDGGVAMRDTTDDPFLWSPVPVAIRLPARKTPGRPSLSQAHTLPFGLAMAALLLIVLVGTANGMGRLAGPEFRTRCRRIVLNTGFGWLVALLVVVGTIYMHGQATKTDVRIEVDMLVSRGTWVELWCNDTDHPPERVPVVTGERHIYQFEKMPRTITMLRIDPTDVADAHIILYGVAVKSKVQMLQQYGPEDLAKWTLMNLSSGKIENGGLSLEDTNDDPGLRTRTALLVSGTLLQLMAATLIETPDAPFLLAITGFLLVLLGRMSTRGGRLQALLAVAVSCVAFPIVWLILKLHVLPPPPVTAAVGYVGYRGYYKAEEYLAALVLLVVAVLLCFAFTRFSGRVEEEPEEAASPVTESSNRRRTAWIVHAVLLGLIVVYFLPNIHGVVVNLPGLVHSDAHGTDLEFVESLALLTHQHAQWDMENMLTWTYMLNAGLRPLRDFWFPYTGGYLQMLPFPVGPMTIVAHCALILWILYWSLYRISGRQLWQTLSIYGLILSPILLGMVSSWDRYLCGVDVALFYVAICEEPLGWRTHAPFAAFVGYLFFYEPPQVLYACGGIAAHIALTALSRSRGAPLRERVAEGLRVLRRRLIAVGVPMLAGLGCAVAIFAANGMLPGLWSFEKGIGDQGNYSSVPASIDNWVLPLLQPDTIFLLMFLLTSYAVYRWMTRPAGLGPDPLESAVLVLCGATYVAMQKQILRPHMMEQVRIYPYVAVMIFGLIAWRERRPAARIIIAVFVGCILGIGLQRGEFQDVLHEEIQEGPARVSGTIRALLNREAFEQANAKLYSRATFAGFDEENAVADNLIQSGVGAEDNIYVLGDDSLFYILLNKQPPYLSNSYNGSPIYEQQKVVDWLEQKKPRFVVWRKEALSFDGVPHIVRLPLIYTYAVEHYEFLRSIGPYEILAPRAPGKPIDLAYWRPILGDRVDLGSIPGLARLAEYDACSGGTGCDAVLVVKGTALRGKLTVDLESTAGLFRIDFDVTPQQREYVINLNRLWFWSAVSSSTPPKITAEDSRAVAVMEYRRERTPVLY